MKVGWNIQCKSVRSGTKGATRQPCGSPSVNDSELASVWIHLVMSILTCEATQPISVSFGS